MGYKENEMITYLCGGINGLSDDDCKNWREDAKTKLKTETLDPMRRDYRGHEDDYYYEIVLGDLDDIVKSDFVLVNATRPSWGTAMEIVYAQRAGCVIVAFTGESKISPWLRYHVTSIVKTPDDAIETINKLSLQ